MKLLASLWASVRNWTWIDWVWRLSVLVLPWQTRWFHEGLSLGGYPWEQSRLSVYGVWVMMILVVIAAISQRHRPKLNLKSHGWLLGLVLITCASIYPIASLMWWMQMVLIMAWGWSLTALNIDRRDLMKWLILSLLPSAILACIQSGMNVVIGSKWLGIAAQDPQTPGVSVLLVEGERLLRAYGTFPHPNIFGAWMALGSVLSLVIASQEDRFGWKQWWLATGSLLLAALTLSYSRSGWLAAVIGFILVAWQLYRAKASSIQWQAWVYLGLVFACALVATSPRWLARVEIQDRLEQKSVTERGDAFKQTWEVGKRKWLLGNGVGTSILALAPRFPDQVPVPPHAVPAMVWLETGVLGLVCLILGAWFNRRRLIEMIWIILLIPAFIFDHFLWSLWSGQLLLGICVVLAYLPLKDSKK